MASKQNPLTATNCRICFTKCPNTARNTFDIADVFHEVTGYEIGPHDIPKKICENCLKNLKIAQEFQQLCKNAEIHLICMRHELTTFEQIPIKEEIEIEEIQSPMIFEPVKSEDSSSEEDNFDEIAFNQETKISKYENKSWEYQYLEKHLRDNNIEPTEIHRFVLDFEQTRPVHLMDNEIKKKPEFYEIDDFALSCTCCSFKTNGDMATKTMKVHCEKICTNLKFRCTCETEFFCLDLLREHVTKNHPENRAFYRELRCDICEFVCCFEDIMENHCKKMHENEVNLMEKCKDCDLVFFCDDLKLQHIIFRCNLGDTGLEIPFKSLFLQESNSILCDYCGKSLYKLSLKDHIERMHGKNRYECDICGRNFRVKTGIQNHMLNCHIVKNYPCQFCDKVFLNPSLLKNHRYFHHSADPYKHKCETCDKRFTTATRLKYHVSVHLPTLPFACQECGARFRSQFRLKYHINTVHSKRQLPCAHCEKTFKTKKLLNQHEMTHESNQYFCPLCPVAYAGAPTLKSHILKHHPGYKLPPPGTVLKSKNLNELKF